MVSGKIELLLSLKNKFKTGLSEAKAKLSNGIKEMKADISGLKTAHIQAFDAMKSQIPGLGNLMEMVTNPYIAATAAAIALGAVMVKGTKMAMAYEEGMAKINATAQLSTEKLGDLRNQLMDIGKDSGGNFERIPESFEKILSQVNDTSLSVDILKASVKGAKAGFTDLDVVSGAVAQSLSVIGKENASAQEVLDTFFAAKRIGAGEFKDFAQYLPTLIAAGKNLGLNFKSVSGIFAYMTGKGQDAANAAMLMQNAFSALGKGEIIKGLDKAGIHLFDKKGMIRDFDVVMNELGHKMAGMSDKNKSAFLESIGLRDVQAKNAIAILTSDAGKLTEAFDATKNSIGEMQKALEDTHNPTVTWGDIMDKIKFLLTKIGYVILPWVDKAFTYINDTLGTAIDYFTNLYKQSELFRDIVNHLGIFIKIAFFPLYAAYKVVKGVASLIQWVYEELGGQGNVFEKMFGKAEKWYYIAKRVLMDIMEVATSAGKVIGDVFSGHWKDAVKDFASLKSKWSDVKNKDYSKDFYMQQAGGEKTLFDRLKVQNDFNPLGFGQNKQKASPYVSLTPKKEEDKGKGKANQPTAGNQITSVTGDSKQQRNISIRIDALHKGDVNVSSENISKMSPTELEKWFQNMLLRTLRNVEAAY